MTKKPKIIVILPAFNAEKTLKQTVADIPKEIVSEIILVDDGSRDGTAGLAKKIGLTVFEHEKNKGYGANQKTCYRMALERGADIIAMLHPDYQYDPKLLKYLIGLIEDGYFDLMLGSRIRSRREALAGGMPLYKYLSNRLLTIWENFASGYNLSEWHSGMRVYRREVLEKINFLGNSDDFSFDSQMLFQALERGYRIGEIPVPVRYFPEASSINFWASLKYGFVTFWLALRFFIKRIFRYGRKLDR